MHLAIVGVNSIMNMAVQNFAVGNCTVLQLFRRSQRCSQSKISGEGNSVDGGRTIGHL